MRHRTILTVLLGTLVLSGCAIGAKAIRANRFDYNSAIQVTAKEQLLANILRMRSDDVPLFLDVTSMTVTTQTQASLAGKATFPGGELDPGLTYSEQPAITYTPIQGDALIKQFMLPIDPAVIVNLYHSGWRLEWLLFLALDRLTPKSDVFPEAINVLQELDDLGALDLGTVSPPPSGPTVVVINGDTKTREKDKSPQGGTLLFGIDPRLATASHYARDAAHPDLGCPAIPPVSPSERAACLLRRFATLMDRPVPPVESGAVVIPVRSMAFAPEPLESRPVSERSRSPHGGLRTQQGGTVLSADSTRVRSPLGALKYAAETASLLQGDISYCSENLPSWRGSETNLVIYVAESAPELAYAKVRYSGCWYYILSGDKDSRFIFSILSQILVMQSSSQTGPQLTLPVSK